MKKLLFGFLLFCGTHINAQENTINNDTSDVETEIKEIIPTISLDQNDLDDNNDQSVSSLLSGGRDPYYNAATFAFGIARYKIRGYDADNFVTYMNGIPIENLDNGFTPFNLWSGLNDMTRFRDNSFGLASNPFTYGEIGGATAFDTRASKQRKQLRLSYAASNRTYDNRFMASYASGITDKGWSVALSGSRRWANEGYVPGTFYDAWAYFMSVEKLINLKHSLAFTTFGAPIRNGRSTSSTQEMYDLAGTNYYNPNWGYQEGEIRNASVATTHQPMFILTHEGKFSDKTNLLTSVGFSLGKRNTTALDWYNAPDPRPDYYRKLPSYYYLNGDTAQGDMLTSFFQNNEDIRQLQWDEFYQANQNSNETVKDVYGIPGNDVTGKMSHYIIEERVSKNKRISVATTLNHSISDHIQLTGGGTYQWQRIRNYKVVDDLLGGDFYVDFNEFAEFDFPDNDSAIQSDLNNPNRIVREGDKLGYDYDLTVCRPALWAQTVFKYNHIDFFVSVEGSHTRFWREGYTKFGLFPNNSFGESEKQSFWNFGVKGGLTYKINGRNYIFANGSYATRAPFFENAFISPRTRDLVVPNLQSEKVMSVEGGYILNAPRIKARVIGYYTQFQDQTNVLSFYNDAVNSFVNYSLTNIDKLHVGMELGVEGKIYKGFSGSAALGFGRYYYTDRMKAYVTADNTNQVLAESQTIYNQYMKIHNTPQLASTLGFSYRSPKFWFVYVNFNYFDQIYLDWNPVRRTAEATELVTYQSEQWYSILEQEKLKGQFTMDASGGYSWKLDKTFDKMKKAQYLNFNVGLTNLTNNKKFITGGFEQLRYDFDNKNPDKFQNRYNYATGISFFAGITYRM